MLNISEELKQIYKNDLLPIVDNIAPKDLSLYFPLLNLTIDTDKIKDDSFELSESLCSDNDLTLGSCEAAQFKATVADITVDLKDQTMIVKQIVDGIHEMPLGTYVVNSVQKQADLRFKEIVAYDAMKSTDKDVSTWYNSLTFPITKKNMLHSLLDYLGIEYEIQTLPNDDVLIEKTVNPSYLKGRDTLSCLCEISGGFGHITRSNKFKTILLSGLGLYPSESLYPAEDLFPSESNEFVAAGYMSADYEEYIVESITGLKITQDDEDYGTMVGISDNIYTITGNFLLYGKSSTELKSIAENILLVLKNKYYRPHTTKMIGLPYIEVGDAINIITTNDAIETFVFQRTLKGIQALTDEISATGNKIRDNTPSPNNEIQQLKGKTLKITKTIEELSSTMTDIEEGLESKIIQTAGQLQTQITDNKNDLQSQITQTTTEIRQEVTDNTALLQGQISLTASGLQTQITDNKNNANSQISQLSGQISFKVSEGDVSSQLSIESDKVTFNSNRLIVNSTNFKLDGNGNAEFSGKVKGATIEGSKLVSEGTTHKTTIESGTISTSYINVTQMDGNYTTLTPTGLTSYAAGYGTTYIIGGKITCSQLIGTASNASNASNADNASYASNLGYSSSRIYMSVNDNVIPNSSSINLGSSSNRYYSVYANNVYNSNGIITQSDAKKKKNIKNLDESFLRFAKMIVPYTYQMINGTSGRYHTGFIADEIKDALDVCGISTEEFGGYVEEPIYSEMYENGEYNTESEIIGYDKYLRYEEFIPLLFLLLNNG